MASDNTYGRTANGALLMSPFDHVRAQLGRQKWAVDTHNEGALYSLYTRDCTVILKQDGVKEIGRFTGRDVIIPMMVAGWAKTPNWMPGSMIHQIGTQIVEAAPDGMISSWSYATYMYLLETGMMEIHGYGKYYDIWKLEDEIWRLHSRETHIFGLKLDVEKAT